MTKAEVLALLKENQNQRGIAHWEKLEANASKLKSFGIGLTQLRKLARQIGQNRKLAGQLWKSNFYDAKVLGLLIDDPKQMTRKQAEQQVEQLNGGMLIHVFASCDATLAKTSFAFELAQEWTQSADSIRLRCGYGLLYELSKKKNVATDEWFMDQIKRIGETIHDQDMWVKESMKCALMGIGKRNIALNEAAIASVKAMGDVDADFRREGRCEPMDVLKHLTSDHLKKKFSK